MNYPRNVYKSPGSHSCQGGSFDLMSVNDEEEHEIAIIDGWFDSIPDALEGKKTVPVAAPIVVAEDDAPPTRDEMMAKAKELGIKVDGRWSDERLMSEIEQKLGDK
jgi:hypothetical protein